MRGRSRRIIQSSGIVPVWSALCRQSVEIFERGRNCSTVKDVVLYLVCSHFPYQATTRNESTAPRASKISHPPPHPSPPMRPPHPVVLKRFRWVRRRFDEIQGRWTRICFATWSEWTVETVRLFAPMPYGARGGGVISMELRLVNSFCVGE